MNFGEALEALKSGEKVARKSWNGKGMYLYYTAGSSVPYSKLKGETQRNLITYPEPVVKINAHIDMKAADDTIVIGWLASQTDMLAEDWHLIE